MAEPPSGTHVARRKSKSRTTHDNADASHICSYQLKEAKRTKISRRSHPDISQSQPKESMVLDFGTVATLGEGGDRKKLRVLLSVGYKGMFSLLKIFKYLPGLEYFFICMLHFNKKIFKKTGTFLAVQ